MVLDGRKGPAYGQIVEHGPTFRADGTLEYLAFKGGSIYRVKHVPQ